MLKQIISYYSRDLESVILQKSPSYTGLFIALLVLGSWVTSTVLLMQWQIDFKNPVVYLMIFVQMHLYTGLFITAHDAMHGTIAPDKYINNGIGYICTFLYASFWYPKLYIKHHQHHDHVHTDNDPDFHNGTFFKWYVQFIRNYLSLWQIVVMAIVFNVLKILLSQANLLLFWVVPSLLSTLQLFYFGTYLPHKGQHDNKHQSRSFKRNHFLAFISCYFFGYHYEHHDAPWLPWWKLWTVKK